MQAFNNLGEKKLPLFSCYFACLLFFCWTFQQLFIFQGRLKVHKIFYLWYFFCVKINWMFFHVALLFYWKEKKQSSRYNLENIFDFHAMTSSQQLQGSAPFFSSRRAPWGGNLFSESKIFSSTFHRRGELFSAVCLFNRVYLNKENVFPNAGNQKTHQQGGSYGWNSNVHQRRLVLGLAVKHFVFHVR